jgi:hypothetical protein
VKPSCFRPINRALACDHSTTCAQTGWVFQGLPNFLGFYGLTPLLQSDGFLLGVSFVFTLDLQSCMQKD